MSKLKRTAARVASMGISLAMALSAFPAEMLSAAAESADTGAVGDAQADALASEDESSSPAFTGEGTEASPFEIETAEDLRKMSELVNGRKTYETGEGSEGSYASAYYVLKKDIDLSTVCGAKKGNWQPIGRSENGFSSSIYNFDGVFDGNGHTMSNLYIERSQMTSGGRVYYEGLFGHNSGTIKNLNVKDAQLLDLDFYNGIIAATNEGKIENCVTSGKVSGSFTCGGIVGAVDGSGTIKNCYSTADISGSTTYGVGYVQGAAAAENCYYLDTQSSIAVAGVTAMSAEDFNSGKVAWLLQNGQETAVWEQSIGSDSYPVLHYDGDPENAVYKVSFVLEDTEVAEEYQNTGKQLKKPDVDVDINGYTVGEKWYKTQPSADDSSDSNEWIFENNTVEKADLTLYTTKTPVKYTIKYELNDGEIAENDNPAEYNVESQPITLKEPTKEGYEFTGWSGTGISGDPEKNVTIPTGSTGNREYTANYRNTMAPTAAITVGETDTWTELSAHVEFNTFYNSTQTVTIEGKASGSDNNSDVTIEYYLSDKQLTEDELKVLGDGEWTKYDKPFSIHPEQQVVIYAKVSDNNGNIAYINSDGLVFDVTRPQITGVVSGRDYCESVTFTVSETYLDSVTVDGQTVELSGNGTYTVSEIGTHTVVATDKAGNTEKVENFNIKNHTRGMISYNTTKYPDCDDEGSRIVTVYCSNCHQKMSTEVQSIPAKGHTFGDWVVIESPDCDDDGVRSRTCEVCKYVETENISETGHTWNDHYTIDKAATCTETGSRSIRCSKCGAVKVSETIPMTDHVPGTPFKDKEIPADCTERGSYESVITCTVCHTELSRTPMIEYAKGHDYTDWVMIESPDCDDEGTLQRTCKVCGIVETENISADGHTWETEPRIDQAPTCTTVGSKSIHCAKCDATKDSETIPSTGHTPAEAVEENVIAATCTTAGGYDEVVYCEVCNGEVSRTAKMIPALGHSFGEWTNVEMPDCDDEGTEMRTCTVCGLTETRGLATLGHDWESNYTIDSNATCTEDGSRSIHCKNCEVTKDSEVIPATGHTLGEPVRENVKEPSCLGYGSYDEVVYCEVCGEEVTREQRSIPALGHDMTDWVTIESPNCTDDGVQTRSCKTCGYTETRNIDETGHDWEADYTVDKEPDCTNDGSRSIHCNNCDAIKDSEVIPSLGGHKDTRENSREASCTEEGYTGDKVCSQCGEVLEKGETIPKLPHSFENGICTVCGEVDEDTSSEEDTSSDPDDSSKPNDSDSDSVPDDSSKPDDSDPDDSSKSDGNTVKVSITFGGDANEDTSQVSMILTDEEGNEYGVEISDDGTFVIENVLSGIYTITASMDKYAPRSYTIEIGEEPTDLEIRLHLYGDVNGDGRINVTDIIEVAAHIKGVKTMDDYAQKTADVNQDKSANFTDLTMIAAKVKGIIDF